jgi:hypothetical protein
MPVDKLLSKIRSSIEDLAPACQPFTLDTVQPGVEECARLQQQVHELLELLGAYKYTKQNYELSPSFNLHAHISEVAEQVKTEAVPPPEPAQTEEIPAKEAPKEKPAESPSAKNGGAKLNKPLFIGVNDKFRFINELFAHQDAEYNIAVEQLSNLQNWPDTEIYLTSLKNLYGWKENHDAVKYFYSIVKRRFQ